MAEEAPEIGALRRSLAVGAAVVPGLLLHGSGHAALGRWDVASRLFLMEGAGLVSIVGGIAGLAVTGAYDTLNPLFIGSIAGGALAFFGGWLMDIYGSSGGAELRRFAAAPSPLTVSLGYIGVANPILDRSHYVYGTVAGRLGRWALGAQVTSNVEGESDVRARTTLRYRVIGETPRGEQTSGNDWLEVHAGYTFHTYGSSAQITEHTGEAMVVGRLGLERFADTLRGAFAEAGFGFGFGSYVYEAAQGADGQSTLLIEMAIGMYLGDGVDSWGEVAIAYDHRHDGHIGGLKLGGLGSGTAGSAILRARRSVLPEWGLEAQLGAGSALVASAGLVYRMMP